jgi:hypothetical protein
MDVPLLKFSMDSQAQRAGRTIARRTCSQELDERLGLLRNEQHAVPCQLHIPADRSCHHLLIATRTICAAMCSFIHRRL